MAKNKAPEPKQKLPFKPGDVLCMRGYDWPLRFIVNAMTKDGTEVECLWFDKQHVLHSAWFPRASLYAG